MSIILKTPLEVLQDIAERFLRGIFVKEALEPLKLIKNDEVWL